MAKRYFGFFDVDDKRYMLFEGANNEVFYHIPNLTSDKYTTVDDEIVFRVVQELQKKRCVAVETISCDGNLIDVKLNLFTKKFWFVNQESGVRIPYEKCSLLYDKYNPPVVAFSNQSDWDSSWENENADYDFENDSVSSDWGMNDSFRDSSSEIKKKRKKQKMIVSIASGLAITIALSIGTWSFLNRDSLSSDISIHRAEESIVTEEIQAFFDDVKYIEVQLREQGLSDSLIKSTLDMYVNFNMPKDFLAVYQQQASEIVAEEESVIDLEVYKDDEVVQMFWNALNENPNITDDEREFIRTNFSSMVYNYKDKLSVIDIVNDVHKMKIVYDSNSCVDNGENVEGTYTWSDKLITIYNSTSFEDAKKTALSHEFNHLLLGPFLGRYR